MLKNKLLKNKLLKNALIYTLGGILLQGINFFTLPIFSRILSVKDFGIVSIYSTWLNILTIFVCLQSHGSIGNAKINYSKDEFEKYVSNIVLFSSIIFTFWILIFSILNSKIISITNLSSEIILILLFQSFFYSIVSLKITIYMKKKLKKNYLYLFLIYF